MSSTGPIVEPHVRFDGEVGERATLSVLDHAGDALAFEAFSDIGQLFARESMAGSRDGL